MSFENTYSSDTQTGGLDVPDYKGEVESLVSGIEDINTLVNKGLMKTEVADEEVTKLESQIHSIESSVIEDENNKTINELKVELDNINKGVQSHGRNFIDSDERVEEIERQIRNLEGSEDPSDNEETGESVPDAEKSPEVDPERLEYLRLKQEFKQSERAYYDAISEDYADRNQISKLFGAGRMNMSIPVQEAYDKFMEANNAYYKFAQTSGVYQKITERLNRDRTDEQEAVSATPLVAGRHILNPAEKRLELQTVKLPEGLQKLKEGFVNKIKSHPKTALTLAGLVMLTNPTRLIGFGTGLATMYLGNKFYVKPKEERQELLKWNASNMVGKWDELDLEALEQEYFKATNLAHNAKRRTRMAAIAGGVTAAGVAFSPDSAYGEILAGNSVPENLPVGDIEVGSESVPPFKLNNDLMSYEDVDVDLEVTPVSDTTQDLSDVEAETVLAPESITEDGTVVGSEEVSTAETETVLTPESVSRIDYIHEIKPGENMSTILFDSIKERIATGEINLPPGVSREELAHYMYQSFPEMTSATDISPKLSPEEWINIGVESGNPHIIKPGETINLQILLEKMWGSSLESNPVDSGNVDDVPETLSNTDETTSDIEPADIEPAPLPEDVVEEFQPITSGTVIAPEDIVIDVAEDDAVSVVDSSEPVISSETTSPSVDSTESGAYVDVDKEILLEDAYKISSAYEEITHQFFWKESMHEYLAKTIEQGMESGEITLPLNVAFGEHDFSSNIMGLVEQRLPEVSRSLFNWDSDALTPEQWKEFGISSGDPKSISPDDVFKPNKLFEYIVSGNKDVLLTKTE